MWNYWKNFSCFVSFFLKKFFKISKKKQKKNKLFSPNTNSETKTCFIQFKERNSVEAAKLLTKTEILGKPIIVEDGQFAKEVPMQGISALSSIKNSN